MAALSGTLLDTRYACLCGREKDEGNRSPILPVAETVNDVSEGLSRKRGLGQETLPSSDLSLDSLEEEPPGLQPDVGEIRGSKRVGDEVRADVRERMSSEVLDGERGLP